MRRGYDYKIGSLLIKFGYQPINLFVVTTSYHEHPFSRFCHVTAVTEEERNKALTKQTEALQDIEEPIVMLKGLPFKTSEEDIRSFFPELEILSVEVP